MMEISEELRGEVTGKSGESSLTLEESGDVGAWEENERKAVTEYKHFRVRLQLKRK